MNNNKVEIKLCAPVILEGNRVRFDQLFHSYDNNCLVENTNGLYHASQGFLSDVLTSGLITVEDKINPSLLPCKIKKGVNIDTGSGVWQNYKRKVEYLVVDKVVFYCRADSDFIKKALTTVGDIGEYTNLGFGEIESVHITEVEDDYSFIKDSAIMRSIPVGVDIDIDFGNKPLTKHSYYQSLENCYLNDTLVLCYNPNQL